MIIEEKKFLLGFSKLDGVGSFTLSKIHEFFGSFKKAWHAPISDWIEETKIQRRTFEKFKENQAKIDLDKIEEELISKNINFITIFDEEYPEILKNIYDPPYVLYYLGDFKNIDLSCALGVVGSRSCSISAIDNTKKVINGFRGTNITIISGGAKGIDTSAHVAALEANLKTIAVLGSGFDFFYPSSNKALFKKIKDGNGCLLTECYPHFPPEAFRFPRRNRIISGLSKGVLVAEAALKSGALITARLTLEQGKELMCFPASLDNKSGEGTLKLLKEGALLVTESKDIIEYLRFDTNFNQNLQEKNEINLQTLTIEERLVYDLIAKNPLKVDEIVSMSKLDINEVMVTLTTLELGGFIKQVESETYLRA